jgi:predicted methyltransferase
MNPRLFGTVALGSFVLACGSSPPTTAQPGSVAANPVSIPAAPAPAEPKSPFSAKPALSPEETKKQEALAALERDRSKMKTDHEAEMARWTPELREAAKALADKAHPTPRAALQAAIAGKHRKPENTARDEARHPLETLEFFGFKPTMTVLEYGPGGGWYTEILAPALAKRGKLLVTTADPKGPPEERQTYYAERLGLFLDSSPELYGKVERVVIETKPPKIPALGKADLALVIRGMHGMVNAGTLDAWLGELRDALKPNGVLGVVQHRAKADANVEETSKGGYLPEKWVIERVEAAGFKLAAKSEINANPKDTKDHPQGVWALPPTLTHGDTDREKYIAIGESDRMTLRFTKVAKKKN